MEVKKQRLEFIQDPKVKVLSCPWRAQECYLFIQSWYSNEINIRICIISAPNTCHRTQPPLTTRWKTLLHATAFMAPTESWYSANLFCHYVGFILHDPQSGALHVSLWLFIRCDCRLCMSNEIIVFRLFRTSKEKMMCYTWQEYTQTWWFWAFISAHNS